MKIEILCTGDEILTGKTVNTNFSYMAQRLTENALDITWGTVVGDDRDSLTRAFVQASERADAVIVNGGLGPTVDDLSQEVAAAAAGVELECHENWLARLHEYYTSRGRKMPENNTKQAMLPTGAEFIDNPIGTACGFAIDINKARFFFTPGVPREMHRMVNEQVIPRRLTMSGTKVVTTLKRFHTFGIGESRADQLLEGVIDNKAKNTTVKLGFQTHYPQLETKLSIQAPDKETLNQLLQPIADELRNRLGNFILCEDDNTLEGTVLDHLHQAGHSLSCAEIATGGAMANRFMQSENYNVLKQCLVSPHIEQLCSTLGVSASSDPFTIDQAVTLAQAQRKNSGADYAIVVITSVTNDGGNDALKICIGIAGPQNTWNRLAVLPGRKGWVRLGATELGIDCLRRVLHNLPVDEKIDFEQQ